MNIDDPRFEEFQQCFEALSEQAESHTGPRPEIASSALFLCLYGDNSLTPDQEFEMLAEMNRFAGQGLHKTTIQSAYWEDIILFVPQNT